MVEVDSNAKMRVASVSFGALGSESGWRQNRKPYRPVRRRWDIGERFYMVERRDKPLTLERVARLSVLYRRRRSLKNLLELRDASGALVIDQYDEAVLELGDQYDVTIDDDINLCIFRTEAQVPTRFLFRFFDWIGFTHAGPIEILTLATSYPHTITERHLVGFDYATRNPNVAHKVLSLRRQNGVIKAQTVNTLGNHIFVPHGHKHPESFDTLWPAGTLFAGIDKNFGAINEAGKRVRDPLPFEDDSLEA